MLLQKLKEYGDRIDLPPAMYKRTPVRWLIDLDGSGALQAFVPQEGRGRRGKAMEVPYVMRAYAIRPKLLADNAEYVLGIARDPKKQARVDKCHAAFVAEVERCAQATEEPAVRAVVDFLKKLDREKLELPDAFDPSDVLTFSVEGTLPTELASVQSHWAEATADTAAAEAVMECLVCGERKTVEKRLPVKFKRIPNGQPSGTALVSANAGAFESYGLEASLISPICRDCGERFGKAANDLLQDERRHLRVGPTVFAFWTRSEDDEYPVAMLLQQPEPDQVRALISSVWRGREEALAVEEEPFYAVAFSGSGGRVVVRDWIDTTVSAVKRNLGRYFAFQRIVDPENPGDPRPFGIFALAASTVRDVDRELPDLVPRRILAFALQGRPLPDRLLFEAVRRNRLEQRVTRPRAGLIKLVMHSQSDPGKEDRMVELDRENAAPAYLCGRLLAVLEEVQDRAIPGAKATLTDRFFGSASSAPASVFGHLLRNTQAHMAKLRKDPRGKGAYVSLDKKLQEVMDGLPGFPHTLTMREQALFSLGYYHQRAERWRKAENGADEE